MVMVKRNGNTKFLSPGMETSNFLYTSIIDENAKLRSLLYRWHTLEIEMNTEAGASQEDLVNLLEETRTLLGGANQ